MPASRNPILLVLLVLLSIAAPCAAQEEETGNENATAAYFALSNSPLGGAPSVFPRALIAGPSGMAFRGHAGFTDEEGELSRRLLALGLDLPAGMSSVGFSLGISDFSCDFGDLGFEGIEGDCGSMYTGAMTWTMPMITSPVGTNGKLVLGFDAGVGYATGEEILDFTIDFGFGGGTERLTVDGSGLSASIGLPFALVSRGGGIAFTPHLAPRIGFGRTSQEATSTSSTSGTTTESATESGVIFMLGGGVSVIFERQGLALDIGFQKSFVEDTNMTIGLGFSFVPRR